MRPQAVASRHIDILSHDLLEIGRDSRVREEVRRCLRREVDEEVHSAVGAILVSHDRPEDRDMDDPPLAEFELVGADQRQANNVIRLSSPGATDIRLR